MHVFQQVSVHTCGSTTYMCDCMIRYYISNLYCESSESSILARKCAPDWIRLARHMYAYFLSFEPHWAAILG